MSATTPYSGWRSGSQPLRTPPSSPARMEGSERSSGHAACTLSSRAIFAWTSSAGRTPSMNSIAVQSRSTANTAGKFLSVNGESVATRSLSCAVAASKLPPAFSATHRRSTIALCE
eukprot:Amastigsp_a182025_11.p4 type:complete len:116 gc:universal Amastigsp_a182025_11:63-410(+)